MRIVTDSTPPEAPKDPETSTIFQIYRLIASPPETAARSRERFRAGIGWGDAKRPLLDRLEASSRAPRARYDALMADPARIDALLARGAQRARDIAAPVIERVRRAIGIAADRSTPPHARGHQASAEDPRARARAPRFCGLPGRARARPSRCTS